MALYTLPLIARMAQHMRDLDLILMFLLESIHLLSKQDVILGLIRIDDAELGLIALGLEYPCNELISRREARTTQDQSDPLESHFLAFDVEFALGLVCDIACRPSNLNLFANGHTVEDVAHCASGLIVVWEVRLHHELEGAILFAAEDWTSGCVWTDHHLVRKMETELDVLACMQAKSFFRVRESKGIGPRVLRKLFATFQTDRYPSVLLESNVLVSFGFSFLLRSSFGVLLDERLGLFGNYAQNAF